MGIEGAKHLENTRLEKIVDNITIANTTVITIPQQVTAASNISVVSLSFSPLLLP